MTTVGSWFASGHSAHLGSVIAAACAFFDAAASAAPCVAFIDELDAIPDRATMDHRGRDWWTPVVTTLLTQIDQMRLREGGVLLVAATNHLDRLDGALKRPGRFDRHIEIVGPRTIEEVLAVMQFHAGQNLTSAELTPLARLALAQKATGAMMESWIRGARELARASGRPMAVRDLSEVIAPVGLECEDTLRETALHESGHAIVARLLGGEVESVSILAVGSTLGLTVVDPTPKVHFTLQDLEDSATVGLAGRAVDEVLLGRAHAGAANDLMRVTRLLAACHATFGLGDTLVVRAESDKVLILIAGDPQLSAQVEADMRRLTDRARDLVRRHEGAIRTLAETLMQKRVVGQDEVDAALMWSNVAWIGPGSAPEDPSNGPSA